MNDILAMDVFYAVDQLGHVISGLRLGHHVAALQHVHQGLPGAVLQDDVNIVPIFEVLEELYYVFVS